jgi:bud emergence protein 1
MQGQESRLLSSLRVITNGESPLSMLNELHTDADAIVLSTRFVAKPIGRLGGPGLIPVSFVEIRDPVTSRPIENVAELLQQGSVPQVDAWKKAAEDYKAASIPLGSFDYPQSGQGRHQADGSDRGSFSRGTPERKESADEGAKTDVQLRDGEIISTHVKSFHYEAEAYWFRINALFLPDDPDAQAVSLVLYRLYEDFYNFQITLLDLFPKEAGRGGSRDSYQSGTAPAERILPYMPGPLEQVDVDITNTRREDLDTYLRELLARWPPRSLRLKQPTLRITDRTHNRKFMVVVEPIDGQASWKIG